MTALNMGIMYWPTFLLRDVTGTYLTWTYDTPLYTNTIYYTVGTTDIETTYNTYTLSQISTFSFNDEVVAL